MDAAKIEKGAEPEMDRIAVRDQKRREAEPIFIEKMIENDDDDHKRPWIRYILIIYLLASPLIFFIRLSDPAGWDGWNPNGLMSRLSLFADLMQWGWAWLFWCQYQSPMSVNAQGRQLFFRSFISTPCRLAGTVYFFAMSTYIWTHQYHGYPPYLGNVYYAPSTGSPILYDC